jgi:hypothetical protein
VWYVRSSATSRRYIGAACWLVPVRLYHLKRPKSQFWSTMGSFSMIGLTSQLRAFQWQEPPLSHARRRTQTMQPGDQFCFSGERGGVFF